MGFLGKFLYKLCYITARAVLLYYIFSCFLFSFVNGCCAAPLPHGGAVESADYCSEVKVFIEGVEAAAAAVWSGSKFGPGRLCNFNFQRFSC